MKFNAKLPQLYAGFECAQFKDHDLLISTQHTPETNMVSHYSEAFRMGATGFRDGLTPGHDPYPRLKTTWWGQHHKAPVIWDLAHYQLPDEKHVDSVALQVPQRVLLVNEPSVEMLWDKPYSDLTHWATRQSKEFFGDTEFFTCDPFHTLAPEEFYATDNLVDDIERISTVGINYYPHHTDIPLTRVLQEVRKRYPHKKIAITETSWHEGLQANIHNGWDYEWTRENWYFYVLKSCLESGVDVEFICWYPWLDCPPWEDPEGQPYPHGWPAL